MKRKSRKRVRARHPNLGAVFDSHVKHEFVDKDVEATMRTMVADPYVHHVPSLTGGVGYEGVRNFYGTQFVGKVPADTKTRQLSRTVGKDQIVEELIFSFTHDAEIPFMLPGVRPTGKYVEVPLVVVMKIKNGKVAHEHIYWDQASVLAQVGLLDPQNLPVSGEDQAKRLAELSKRLAGDSSKHSHDFTLPAMTREKKLAGRGR